MVSVIIPTWNEAACIGPLVSVVRRLQGPLAEVLVVDGGSTDNTREVAAAHGATVLTAPRGKGQQLQYAASRATGSILWFLHADSYPEADSLTAIWGVCQDPTVLGGHFTLRFDGESRGARWLTAIYPRLLGLGLCYGDSGIFVKAESYHRIGGIRPVPLFEDLDLVQRMRQHGRFLRLNVSLRTSSRRFERRNFELMFAHWTGLQLLYWAGVPPTLLSRLYPAVRSAGVSKESK